MEEERDLQEWRKKLTFEEHYTQLCGIVKSHANLIGVLNEQFKELLDREQEHTLEMKKANEDLMKLLLKIQKDCEQCKK